MFYVYVLKSANDNKLYIGCTEALERRLIAHLNGEALATRGRRPLKLIYYEAYASKSDALARERNLKLYSNAYSQLKRRIHKSIDS